MSDTVDNALPGGDQISDAIQKILANPKIISDVATAMGISPPTSSEGARESEKASEKGSDIGSIISSLAPTLKSISSKGGKGPKLSNDQACLLRALKPYVSESRCQAIDYIIRITEISQLLKNIN